MNKLSLSTLALGLCLILSNCAPSYGPHFTTTGSSIQTNSVEPEVVDVQVIETVVEEVVVPEVVELGDAGLAEEEVETVVVPELVERVVIREVPVIVEEVVEETVAEEPMSRKEIRSEMKERKREFRSMLKERIKEAKEADDSDFVLMMVLAFIIPPVPIAILYGLESEFWISLILTLLFWFPGMIYSMIMTHRYFN